MNHNSTPCRHITDKQKITFFKTLNPHRKQTQIPCSQGYRFRQAHLNATTNRPFQHRICSKSMDFELTESSRWGGYRRRERARRPPAGAENAWPPAAVHLHLAVDELDTVAPSQPVDDNRRAWWRRTRGVASRRSLSLPPSPRTDR
jgi:hypothetical protein